MAANAREQGISEAEVLQGLVGAIHSNRMGTVVDNADTVCFLVSERATKSTVPA